MRSPLFPAIFRRQSLSRLAIGLTALSALLAVDWLPQPAHAQSWGGFFGYESPRPKKRTQARRKPATDEAATTEDGKAKKAQAEASKPTGPLFVVISIADQHITVYNHDGVVTRSRVSTGMAGHPTPKGIFSIIGRSRHHYSNIYGGAPMPYMQRVTWSGVAMHLGVVPGYPASHGCIRLPSNFAPVLWGMTKIGERVVISGRDVAPQKFESALLPVPKMQPDPTVVGATGSVASDGNSAGTGLSKVVATAADAAPAQGTHLLNPLEYAQALKVRATADAAAAARAVKETFETANAKSAEARRAVNALKEAERIRIQMEAKVAAAAQSLATAVPDKIEAAEIAKINAESDLSDAVRKVESARAQEAVATPASFEAVRAWKEAKASVGLAAAKQKEAARRTSPVSVLISKKDQKVYIRQNLMPLLEAPATFPDPNLPLGTHVYIASKADGENLKWTTVSMPFAQPGTEPSRSKKKKGQRDEVQAKPAAPPVAAPTAQEALERVQIPADVKERITELLWTGGSMIITDNSLSYETSDVGTDLVVNTR